MYIQTNTVNSINIYYTALLYEQSLLKFNLSSLKPRHITGGSGRGGARRNGGAGRGWAVRNADGSVRPGDNRPSYSPDDRKKPCWSCL